MTTRLQLIMFPHRRSLTVFPHYPRGIRPDVDFSNTRSPEQIAAARRARAELTRPRGVLLNFDCQCRARDCIGCVSIEDPRLVRFLCDSGYCRVIASDTASSAA